MQLKGRRVLLTGASGGIGCELAQLLASKGAKLVLAGRDQAKLQVLVQQLSKAGCEAASVPLDLCAADLERQASSIAQQYPDIDLLINCAGLSWFGASANTTAASVQSVVAINLTGMMTLTNSLLPNLKARPDAAVVNVGSMFGHIGYPGFSAYCASKFGVRGYSEALRRELADSKVQVFYFAPRAVATDMNAAAVVEMNQELGNRMDNPAKVAQRLITALERDRTRVLLGQPEKLFAFLNGVLSQLVDRALGKQLPKIKRHYE